MRLVKIAALVQLSSLVYLAATSRLTPDRLLSWLGATALIYLWWRDAAEKVRLERVIEDHIKRFDAVLRRSRTRREDNRS